MNNYIYSQHFLKLKDLMPLNEEMFFNKNATFKKSYLRSGDPG